MNIFSVIASGCNIFQVFKNVMPNARSSKHRKNTKKFKSRLKKNQFFITSNVSIFLTLQNFFFLMVNCISMMRFFVSKTFLLQWLPNEIENDDILRIAFLKSQLFFRITYYKIQNSLNLKNSFKISFGNYCTCHSPIFSTPNLNIFFQHTKILRIQ